MSTKLTLPELNTAMCQVVMSGLNVVRPPSVPIPVQTLDAYKDKMQNYDQDLEDGACVNFLCGALAVTIVGNAKLQYKQEQLTSTLILRLPTVVQVSKGKFRASALLLTLPMEEMDSLLATIEANLASVEAKKPLSAKVASRD